MSEIPLFPGAQPLPVLDWDEEFDLVYLHEPREHVPCPKCGNADEQNWQAGEPEFYDMHCNACGYGYSVSLCYGAQP